MSKALPYAIDSRAQIRNRLETPSGKSKLNSAELSEVYRHLTGDGPGEEWPVHRLRKEILDELSEIFETDIRRDCDYYTQLNQTECWYLRRAIENIVDRREVCA